MSEQILRETIVALPSEPVCICRPVGAGDGDTYAINPACPSHGTHGSAPVRAYHVTRIPRDDQPTHTIDNVTELYVFASNGYVNTAKRGEANTTEKRKTAEVTLAVGQRMVIERGDDVMRLEVLPVGDRS